MHVFFSGPDHPNTLSNMEYLSVFFGGFFLVCVGGGLLLLQSDSLSVVPPKTLGCHLSSPQTHGRKAAVHNGKKGLAAEMSNRNVTCVTCHCKLSTTHIKKRKKKQVS